MHSFCWWIITKVCVKWSYHLFPHLASWICFTLVENAAVAGSQLVFGSSLTKTKQKVLSTSLTELQADDRSRSKKNSSLSDTRRGHHDARHCRAENCSRLLIAGNILLKFCCFVGKQKAESSEFMVMTFDPTQGHGCKFCSLHLYLFRYTVCVKIW